MMMTGDGDVVLVCVCGGRFNSVFENGASVVHVIFVVIVVIVVVFVCCCLSLFVVGVVYFVNGVDVEVKFVCWRFSLIVVAFCVAFCALGSVDSVINDGDVFRLCFRMACVALSGVVARRWPCIVQGTLLQSVGKDA